MSKQRPSPKRAVAGYDIIAPDEIVITLPAPGEAPEGISHTGGASLTGFGPSCSCLHIPVDKGPRACRSAYNWRAARFGGSLLAAARCPPENWRSTSSDKNRVYILLPAA